MPKVLLVHSSLSFAKCSYAGIEKMITWVGNNLAEDDSYQVKFLTIYDVERSTKLSTKAASKEMAQTFYDSSFKRLVVLFFPVRKQLATELSDKYDYVISFGDTSLILLMFLKRFYGYKLIVSERSDPYTKGSFFVNLRRKLYRFADKVVFQTEGARNYFSEKVAAHSYVIANPIVIPNVKWNNQNVQKKISTVGRIDFFQKRQDLLIQAFRDFLIDYPDYTLHIYGSGEDETKLITMIKEMNLSESVFFHGATNNVNASILDSKMFVLSSDFEGIPNALLEAMALGVPAISTDCSPGGARMLIDNEVDGILVERGNCTLLCNAMKLLANQSYDLQTLSENARQKMQKFSPSSIIDKWKSVIC